MILSTVANFMSLLVLISFSLVIGHFWNLRCLIAFHLVASYQNAEPSQLIHLHGIQSIILDFLNFHQYAGSLLHHPCCSKLFISSLPVFIGKLTCFMKFMHYFQKHVVHVLSYFVNLQIC